MEIGKILDNLDQEELIKAVPIINEYLLKLNVEDFIILYDKLSEISKEKASEY